MLAVCFLLCLQLCSLFGAPVSSYPPQEMVGFMKSYGYLQETTGGPADIETLYTEEGFREVIRQVQRFGGLNETGQIDESTLALMGKPRCGVPDVLREETTISNRTKRYVVATPGWRKKHLTYFLANWAGALDYKNASESLKKAFGLWSEITPLRFHASSNAEADLVVSFGRGDHGDNYPFDGPGGALAHAFFPYQQGALSGDIHFDTDEDWVDNKKEKLHRGGVDFFTVVTHEIGHSLGLSHSTVQDSIMFPYYKGYTENLKLAYDDVLAMYDLYVRNAMFEDNPTDAEYDKTEKDRDRDHNRQPETPVIPARPMRPERPIYPDRERPTRPEYPTRPVHPPSHPENRPPSRRPSYPRPERPTQPETPRYPNTRPDNDNNGGNRPTDRPKLRPEIPDSDHGGGNRPAERPKERPTTSDNDPRDNPVDRVPNRPRHPQTGEDPKRDKPARRPDPPRDDGKDSKDNRTKIPDLCSGHLDAAALLRNELFVFKGSYMWRFRERGLLMKGYPVLFHHLFVGLPQSIKKIDAIYERPTDHKIVMFTGRKFWLFTGNSMTPDSPKSLRSMGLPAEVNSLDAAFVWAKNEKTYIFKDREYWRFDDHQSTIDQGYPLPIHSRWSGIPDQLDTAITYTDGQTYFFRGDWYWRFDNQGVKVDANFPRRTAEDWFGC